jgi:hypothetical protein
MVRASATAKEASPRKAATPPVEINRQTCAGPGLVRKRRAARALMLAPRPEALKDAFASHKRK